MTIEAAETAIVRVGKASEDPWYPVLYLGDYAEDFDTIAEGFAALKAERDEARADYLRRHKDVGDMMDRALASEAECERLREALKEGRRAIGEHHAPHDCYATGPLTGDPIRDLVQCPACSFIAMHDAAMEGKAHD